MELTRDDPLTSFAPPRSPASARQRHADFAFLTLAISATVFTGFWFTYFGPIVAGKYPQSSPLVHLHGWSFFSWYLLLPIQATLIQTRRVRLHRTLGFSSIALASVMFLTGLTVLGVQMRSALASPKPTFWSASGPAILSTLLLFATFYAAAVLLRHRSAYHKRLIIVASSAGMGAAMFRILGVIFGRAPWVVPASIVVTNLFIVVGIIIDLVRERRIHRVYLIGLPTCVGVELAIYLSTPTPAGHVIARGLAWVGETLGFLY